MSSENTVNSQIVDSVSAASTLLVAQGPAQSFSMLDMVMLETLGTAMHNAVARQQGAGMVSNAAVTATCAKMINAPWPVPPPAPEPPPPPPPQVIPLPGPVPAADIAGAAHLSTSQLHRRFQSELAVTLRGWVLWQRLRRALMHHLRGHTLTDSAHAAGFADLAHLSRSLRRMFGIGAAQLQGLQLHAA